MCNLRPERLVSKAISCMLPATGCSRIPEALQHIFTCLATVIKALAKRFAAAVTAMLRCSRRLRYHTAEHVRSMAAHAFAFPLRHASEKQLKRAVSAIVNGKHTHDAVDLPKVGCLVHSRVSMVINGVVRAEASCQLATCS